MQHYRIAKYVSFIISIAICAIISMVLIDEHDHNNSEQNAQKKYDDSKKTMKNRAKHMGITQTNIDDLNNMIEFPNFYGMTSDHHAFNIHAKFAQKDGGIVRLHDLEGVLKSTHDENFVISATNGTMDSHQKTLYASAGIHFHASIATRKYDKFRDIRPPFSLGTSGTNTLLQYNGFADNIFVDYPRQFAYASDNVRLHTNGVKVSSHYMTLDVAKKIAAFRGNVRIIIDNTQ